MSEKPQSLDPEELLAHAGWVRGLAVALVGESRADDLAQQTMLRAMERPPRYKKNLRGWLGTIARNFAYSWVRTEGRRRELFQTHEYEGKRDFEHDAGSSALSAAPEDLLGKSEAHAQLISVLRDLPDPGRHLLLLRYFEDLTPKQIAERHGMKPSTVRVQLMRATEELRKLMKKRFGGDGMAPCVAILTPSLGKGLVVTAATGGTVATSLAAKTVVLGGILSAITVGVYLWDQPETPSDGPLIGVEATASADESERDPSDATVIDEGVSGFSRVAVPTAPAFELAVVDDHGNPVPGALIRFHRDGVTLGQTHTNADGLLRLKPSAEEVVAQISTHNRAPQLVNLVLEEGRRELVMADGGLIDGRIESDEPVFLQLEAAEQLFREESNEFALLPELDQRFSNFRRFLIPVRKDGEFHYSGLPQGWSGTLASADPRFRIDDTGLDSEADGRLEITAPLTDLRINLVAVPHISGRVMLPEGVEDAVLTMKSPGMTAKRALTSDGCFDFLADPAEFTSLELLVQSPGGYVGFHRFDPVPADGQLGDLKVDFRPPAQLHVTDADGTSLANALVLDLAADGSRIQTNADGRAELLLLSEHPQLLVRASGMQPRMLDLDPTALSDVVKVELQAANQLQLQLRNPNDQVPAHAEDSLVIRLEAEQGLFSGSHTLDRDYQTKTGELFASGLSEHGIVRGDFRADAAGNLTLSGVNAGTSIRAQVWAEGGGLLLEKWLNPTAAGEQQAVTLQLPASRSFRGKLIDPDGRAVTDALVALRTDPQADGFHRATTDLLGRFELPAVYGNEGLLKIVAKGFAFEPIADYRLPAEADEAVIQLHRGRSLQVHVYDQDGTAVSQFAASTYIEDRGSFGSRADANGLLKITGLPLVTLDLQVEVDGWRYPLHAALGDDQLTLHLPQRDTVQVGWSLLSEELQSASSTYRMRLESNGISTEYWLPGLAELQLPFGSYTATLLDASRSELRSTSFTVDGAGDVAVRLD